MVRISRFVYQNPIDQYLKEERESSGLAYLAHRFLAECFDVEAFRGELRLKLKACEYHVARRDREEKTFYDILEKKGLLGKLLSRDTLWQLWKCKLLQKIAEQARDGKTAVDGQSLKSLRKKITQQVRDAKALEGIIQRADARNEARQLSAKIGRGLRRNLSLLLLSTKYKGSSTELLSGRIADGSSKGRRDEDLATKLAIYKVLRARLQKGHTKLLIIQVCQLAELIWAPPSVARLSSGQALYRATRRCV